MKRFLSIILAIAMVVCLSGVTGAQGYSRGDVDRSGAVDSADAALILRYVVGIATFDAQQKTLGDINNSDEPDSADAASILRYVVGLQPSLGEDEPTPEPTAEPTADPTADPTAEPTGDVELTWYYTGNYYSSIGSFESIEAMSKTQLESALIDKISSMTDQSVGYSGLKTHLPNSDTDSEHSGKMRLFYSQEWITKTNSLSSSGWNGWNREHCWPDSMGGGACEGDINVMRPTFPQANSHRGNYGYGEFSQGQSYSVSTSPAGTVCGYYSGGYGRFEPNDNVKGDVARIVLYVLLNSKYDSLQFSKIHSCSTDAAAYEMFLRWNKMDPPDSVELHRNDYCQSIHGNRNPFIDCPALADIIYG